MRSCLRIILLLSLLTLHIGAGAQNMSVNVDQATIAAMTEAYLQEAGGEALHNSNLQKILQSYESASVATAGILASKYLDRQALTNLTPWVNAQENRYYRRIYKLVAQRIIPRTIQCAELMIQDPSTALYWASYLVRTCDDVRTLCQQFESIVTNGTLSFSDIQFLQIQEQIAALADLRQLGDVDLEQLLHDMSHRMRDSFTLENLQADLTNLINKGVGLATAGVQQAMEQLLQGCEMTGTWEGSVGDIITAAGNFHDLYNQYKDHTGEQMLQLLGGDQALANLFKPGDYDLTAWITDYERQAQGEYYTQTWEIVNRNHGVETVCDYMPPTSSNQIMTSSEWTRYTPTDGWSLGDGEKEQVLQNSEQAAGWSRAQVSRLNAGSSTEKYTFSSSLVSYPIYSAGNLSQVAFAFQIRVTREKLQDEVLYSAVYDSYSMDYGNFTAEMRARLEEANRNDQGITYELVAGEKRYYQAADQRKIAASSHATISVLCQDGSTLGSGSTTYKCDECGATVNAHTHSCSMLTTIQDNPASTQELENAISELQDQIDLLQLGISQLVEDNAQLLRTITLTQDPQEIASLQAQIAANKSLIQRYNQQVATKQDEISAYEQAIQEVYEGEAQQTDDYNRIPQLMRAMQQAYGFTWTDGGSWSGNTFIRRATIGSFNTEITFSATLSIAREPKYFLGIKIHRAIVQIDWQCTSNTPSTTVVDVVELDSQADPDLQTEQVNQRLSQAAQQYPDCQVEVTYSQNSAASIQEPDGVQHLLWASDRLEMARTIESRLAKIYTDLSMVWKFMHYRHGAAAWLRTLAPKFDNYRDYKPTVIEHSLQQWLQSSRDSWAQYNSGS